MNIFLANITQRVNRAFSWIFWEGIPHFYFLKPLVLWTVQFRSPNSNEHWAPSASVNSAAYAQFNYCKNIYAKLLGVFTPPLINAENITIKFIVITALSETVHERRHHLGGREEVWKIDIFDIAGSKKVKTPGWVWNWSVFDDVIYGRSLRLTSCTRNIFNLNRPEKEIVLK